ncbi:MAG: enoyl-CoA hydratase/isomerase family protein [Gammaproteobacteria bacterium]|nr:enoyl-CoA hydratase/isomerase family protein [Gammaproteobacteria bacterium]MBT4493916.1 enoyl-CoA hydratase/isomerase family protein [Gammaproteobacteria bacterium]
MGEQVLRQDEDGIAVLTLNRPEALNSLSPSLFVELRKHIDDIAADIDGVGCVILRGEGRSFSAGNDLKAIQAGEVAPSAHFQSETLEAIENLPQVAIASVQGHCYTGSLELAIACDLLIASESAKFADTHGKWAMTPIWGMSQRLPRRIGPLKAKEMMYTGRVVSGTEAAEIGLANECVADDQLIDHTMDVARQIVANSWHTLRADKMLVNMGFNKTLSDGLKFERENSPGPGSDMGERLKSF